MVKSAPLPVSGVKKIIAVASTKGGVGKSSIACNLALALKNMGHKVAIVDADIYGPSVPHLMNLNSKPEVKNDLLLPLISFGIKVMSIGLLIENTAAAVFRGPMTTKILHQLIRSVDWKFDGCEVDFMIIDMPPGTGDVYLTLAEQFLISGVVLVSTPESLSVIDVKRSIDCFAKLQLKIIGLIQNMSYLKINGETIYLFGKDGARELARQFGIEFLGEVAIDLKLSEANQNRKPIIEVDSKSESALAINKIAFRISKEVR